MIQAAYPMKKKPTTDGRRRRYEPISAEEYRAACKELETLVGNFLAAADEIEDMKLAGVQIDGRNILTDAISDLKTVSKRTKTALYQVRLDRE